MAGTALEHQNRRRGQRRRGWPLAVGFHRTLIHLVVGLLCACFVLIVGVFAHVGQLDLGTAPLVKAGGANVISGQLPVIR